MALDSWQLDGHVAISVNSSDHQVAWWRVMGSLASVTRSGRHVPRTLPLGPSFWHPVRGECEEVADPPPRRWNILSQWAITYGLPSRILMAVGSNDIFNRPVLNPDRPRHDDHRADVTVYWPEIHVSRWSQSASIQVADQR